jgi:hypothetical protein
MNLPELEKYFIDTGQKHSNYKLLQCRTCVWAYDHQSELNINLDQGTTHKLLKKRREQLNNHLKECPNKAYFTMAGITTRNLPGSIPPASIASSASIAAPDSPFYQSQVSVTPSESASALTTTTINKKRKTKQAIFKTSFYKDSPVERDPFMENCINIIASTGVGFGFFENPYVFQSYADLRPLAAKVIPSRKQLKAKIITRSKEERLLSANRVKLEYEKGVKPGTLLI